MAIMMITEHAGAGPEVLDGLREHGVFDKMKSAPGFLGHWNGTTDKGTCAIEMWESPEAHQAWFEGTIKPLLPPGADLPSRRGRPATSPPNPWRERKDRHLP